MENNQVDPSPQPTPPPPHSSSQVVWPPHTQSYEINDATSSNQYNDEVQSEVDYSADSSAGVQDFSSGTYPDRFQPVAPAGSGQMIRTMGYDQGPEQGSPFSPQPSTSGSFQVRMHPRMRMINHHLGAAVPLQGYDRISPVDDYQNSPAPSSDDHLQQYDPLPALADQSDQVSSAAIPSQSHLSINIANARVDSPSTVDRGPSPLAIDCSSVALQSHRIPSPLTTMAGQRMSNNLATRYLTSDIVESTINAHGLSLPQHQKELLVEAVTRNMVANQLQNATNHMMLQSQNQRIPSPINMVVSQSQRIPSPSSLDYGNLHANALTLNRNINSMQSLVNQRAMSPVGSVVQNSHRYSPVQLRAMSSSPPILSSSQLAMQNYVSSSTGPMERASSANIISSGAVIDSTVDSTVETADSHLGTADEVNKIFHTLINSNVVGSSGASYMADLDSGDGTLDTTQGVSTTADEMTVDSGTPNSIVSSQATHMSAPTAIDTTVDGIDTTVNTTSLDNSAASGNFFFQGLHQDGLNPVISLPNSVSSAMISQHIRMIDQLDTVANSRPRRQLHKQRMLADQELQRNGDNRIPYPGKQFWCEECNIAYDVECTRHRIQTIFDKPVLSRAWASLPGAYLAINKVGVTDNGEAAYGVFSKKPIPKRTKFGPVEGVITKLDELVSEEIVLQIESESGELMHLDTSDESLSNWMRFVRPADDYTEQNLVVIQSEQCLYFLSTKQISPRIELKVGYAQQYAERRNLKMLEPDEEEMKAMEELENAWPCFECNKQFSNSEDLQKHLNEHENSDAVGGEEESSNGATRKKSRPRGRPPKKTKTNAPKKFKVHEDLQLSNSKLDEFKCQFCPKTFPRNYSLQRHLAMHSGDKKYECPICGRTFSHVYNRNRHVKRHKAQDNNEPYSRPVKSLFKKKQAEGNEWLCTHCDLTFDNASLLNLHTLTHAAENVGLEEVARFAVEPSFTIKNGISENYKSEFETELEGGVLKCPQCTQEFLSKKELIEHASAHGKMVIRRSFRGMINPAKPFKCELCYKSFASEERLLRHNLVHGSEDTKPLQCDICFKRFLNNSALACHIKVHSDEKKYYECPICKEGFDQIILLKDHVHIHCINGVYTCPNCRKGFEEYNQIRKHIRAFHSEKRYPCDQCDKIFPRPDKLKLHMLRHSDHREFLCANCGKQFKRKDKLKEHMKRMHSAEREARLAMKPSKPTSSKKFIPKVSPTDYHRFIYKCHSCLLGFKRRGMLVNHLAKRHPDIRPESVPELNLPILKTTRDYYCQYCEKVYKSSSKRKAHILKNHPGAELPMSNRRKGGIPEIPGLPNPTFSQTVGSITTHPHNCDWCHKQYASKAKLLQHQRKKHLELLPQVDSGCYSPRQAQQIPRTHHRDFNTNYPVSISADNQSPEEEYADSVVIDASSKRKDSTPAPRPPSVYVERDTNTPAMPPHTAVESLQAADLLTQAMSELTQTFNEYRPSTAEFHLSRLTQSGPPTMVQPSPATTPIPQSTTPIPTATSLEQSQLGQILAQYQSQQAAATRASLSPGPQVSPSQSPTPFVPRTWATTFATYPAR